MMKPNAWIGYDGEWQRRVMSVVSQLLPETYIIATTHSPFVLGSVDDAQVFQIYKDERGNLQVKSSYDELYGYPADVVLEKKFVPSLYPPEVEAKLARLGELAGKVVSGEASAQEKEEHDALLVEMKELNPWLENLLALRGSFA
jgi:predicted ATP-binding protein involved in virulence